MDFSTVLANQAAFDSAVAAKLSAIATSLSARAKTADLLDGNGKVLASKLPFALTDLMVNKGGFDATTDNLGTIQGTAQEGWLYVVTTGGNIDNSAVQTGVTSVTAGDILWFVDGGWVHIKSGTVAPGVAGSVLNWAAEQQSHGHVVQFHNLHRLVAVFFNVIGVNEHAWVVPRKN